MHSKEPWLVEDNKIKAYVYNKYKTPLLKYIDDEAFTFPCERKDNLKRAVDCVNALAGIQNPTAVVELIEEVKKILSSQTLDIETLNQKFQALKIIPTNKKDYTQYDSELNT